MRQKQICPSPKQLFNACFGGRIVWKKAKSWVVNIILFPLLKGSIMRKLEASGGHILKFQGIIQLLEGQLED